MHKTGETSDQIMNHFECSFKEFDTNEMRHGYGKQRPAVMLENTGVTVGIGNPDWGAPDYPVFIIRHGEIIETRNIK